MPGPVGCRPGARLAPEFLFSRSFLWFVSFGSGGFLFVALHIIALLEHLVRFEEKATPLWTLPGKKCTSKRASVLQTPLEWFTGRKMVLSAHTEGADEAVSCAQ